MRILIFSFLVLRIRADSFVIIETSSRFCSIVLPLLIVICITGNSKLYLNSVKPSCNVYIFSVACSLFYCRRESCLPYLELISNCLFDAELNTGMLIIATIYVLTFKKSIKEGTRNMCERNLAISATVKIDQAEGFFWALVEFQGNIKPSPGKTRESWRQQEQKLVN
jgi:hypothetical protein